MSCDRRSDHEGIMARTGPVGMFLAGDLGIACRSDLVRRYNVSAAGGLTPANR